MVRTVRTVTVTVTAADMVRAVRMATPRRR